MRLLLLALLPLAAAKCPSFFEGLNASSTIIERFEEAVDVACDRRNYTSVFWSRNFYEQLIQLVANSSDGEALAPFKPFSKQLRAKFEALDTEEATDGEIDAKDFVDSIFARNEKMRAIEERIKNPPPTSSPGELMNPGFFIADMFTMLIEPMTTILSPELSIPLMRTTKSAFGVVETTELKQMRMDRAMKAIEHVGLKSDNEHLGELFARLYILTNETFTVRRSPFDQFAEWAEKQWNSIDFPALVVVPAAEILYVQYQTLKMNESKIFVDWVLAKHARVVLHPVTTTTQSSNITQEEKLDLAFKKLHETLNHIPSQEEMIEKMETAMKERAGQFASICPSQNVLQCYKALPVEARNELQWVFPELFSYLNKNTEFGSLISIAKESRAIERNEIETVEGSGEGSGML